MLKKGTIALQLRCVDVPKQPNPEATQSHRLWRIRHEMDGVPRCSNIVGLLSVQNPDRLDGFRAEFVAKLILSDENTLRVEAVKQENKMRHQVRPSAALKSPYVQVSTAEIDKHH
ncbi:hypothetical protein PIB30_043926 [Stylosanthes scabra]|uniref:Uncharacterized protein n=1 Tax=Stylosanthes scabra TaxID=79078 RepID=A0ABU6WGW1_9FABA|nr:hypothetical protein [Stylosanthes scabra]